MVFKTTKKAVMKMFKGEFTHSIDAKGRVIIPAKYREALGLKCVMAKGSNGTLNIYTQERWNEFDEKFKSMPQSNPKVLRYIRQFYGGAVDLEPDNNGRVMIPANLREFAGLQKDIVTLGVFDHLEIWDAKKYEDYMNDPDFSDEEIMEELASFGL